MKASLIKDLGSRNISKFTFAVVYSVYCGLLFANLCLPESDSWSDRWNWGDPIECKPQDENESLNDNDETYFSREELHTLTYYCWILLIILVIGDLTSEVCSLFMTKCWKLKKSLTKRYSRWLNILADVAIIMVLFNGKYNNNVA